MSNGSSIGIADLSPIERKFHIEKYMVPKFTRLKIAIQVLDPVIPITDILSVIYHINKSREEEKKKIYKKAGLKFRPTNFHYPTAVRTLLYFAGCEWDEKTYHAVLKVANERSVVANKKIAAKVAALKEKNNQKK